MRAASAGGAASTSAVGWPLPTRANVQPGDLADAVRGACGMGWAGFNGSLPHKVHVLEHLDDLAPSAQIIGAVNCVVRDGKRLVGENTDGQGFLRVMRAALAEVFAG